MQTFITSPEKKLNHFEVILKIAAIKNQQIRMDAIGPLGSLVGSMLIDPKKAIFVDYQSKVAFGGEPNAQAMTKLIEVPIDPKIFYALLFDEPIKSPDWECQFDGSGFPVRCEQKKQGVLIEWKKMLAGTKVIELKNGTSEIEMNFRSFSEEIKNKSRRFKIKIPSSYKRYRL
ncbi:MAG: hypothetical protein R2827_00775 [Bdellovibrionales bacterium]